MFEWLKGWLLGISKQVLLMPVSLAAPMMILVGALDSSLLSLPEVNDYITIYRVAHSPNEVWYFPLFPAIGSVIGCLILYTTAQRSGQFVMKRFDSAQMEIVRKLYFRWGVFALAVPALLPPPMPFKVFVATAGVLGFPRGKFIMIILISRSLRYYFWGIAAFIWRDEVLNALKWLEAHFTAMLGIVLAVLALIILVRWGMFFFRSRSRTLKPEQETS